MICLSLCSCFVQTLGITLGLEIHATGALLGGHWGSTGTLWGGTGPMGRPGKPLVVDCFSDRKLFSRIHKTRSIYMECANASAYTYTYIWNAPTLVHIHTRASQRMLVKPRAWKLL